jgi:hypothetical protein
MRIKRSKILKHYFPRFTALTLILIGGVFAPTMKADEWNKKTNITISQPIEIQGTVLPAGSYVIKLLDSPSERYVVQIFNAEENHIITTIFAVPTYRLRPADNSELNFYQSENSQPAALHTWFYPGDSAGFEFSPGRKGVESARGIVETTSSSTGGN